MGRGSSSVPPLLAGLGAFIWRADNYQLYVLALVGLTAIVGVGLNVLLGLSGQISLGHVGLLRHRRLRGGHPHDQDGHRLLDGLPLAGLIAGVAGVLLAVPALRVRGPYLAMVTIAFGFIVEQGAAELGWLTGGWNGLIGIPPPSLAGRKFAEREIAVLVLLLTALAFWLYARLEAGPWGKAMRAVRDSEVASQSIGLDPTLIRTVAFAAIGGRGGPRRRRVRGDERLHQPRILPVLPVDPVPAGGDDRRRRPRARAADRRAGRGAAARAAVVACPVPTAVRGRAAARRAAPGARRLRRVDRPFPGQARRGPARRGQARRDGHARWRSRARHAGGRGPFGQLRRRARRCSTCRSQPSPAASPASSARTAPARARCSISLAASTGRIAARSGLPAARLRASPRTRSPAPASPAPTRRRSCSAR